MKFRTTKRFDRLFAGLPSSVKQRAKKAFKFFMTNQKHPSLRLKRVHPEEPIFSIRVSLNYRALAVKDQQGYLWFWVGSHDDYEKMIPRF